MRHFRTWDDGCIWYDSNRHSYIVTSDIGTVEIFEYTVATVEDLEEAIGEAIMNLTPKEDRSSYGQENV